MDERTGSVRRDPLGEPQTDPIPPTTDPNFDPATATPTEPLGAAALDEADANRVEIERTRAEIERTRADMSETVDAIQGRLSPENLKEQAKDRVKEATVGKAKDAGNSVVETIKENPLPAALTGLGIGWILAKARQRSTSPPVHAYNVREYDAAGAYPATYDRPPYADEYTAGGSTTGGVVERTRDKVGETTGRVQDRAGQAASRAGDAVSNAGSATKNLGERTRQTAQRASAGFGRMLRENPLAVGALATGVGAAVGLAIPETSKEHEVMGEARDNLVNQAQEKVQETQDKAQQVAQEAKNAAQQEAENQGLTSG
jgi:ElaB/YqjD/DUF883 family membrane-anchored ribosome-binding protein